MERYLLFIILTLLVPSLARAEGPVKVTSSYGPVEYEFASGTKLNPIGTSLPSLDIGDKIRTGPGAQLTLALPDSSYMVVSENTTLEIEKFWGSDVRNLMKVLVGKVRFFIQRLGGRPNQYRVNTPTALIAVRGTTFEVNVVQGATTEVLCFKGRVTVETVGMHDREVILDAGRKTIVLPGVYPVRPIEIDEVFAGARVLRVVRQEKVGSPVPWPVSPLERATADNDRRSRQIDPLASPRGRNSLGVEIRRGKLTFPNQK